MNSPLIFYGELQNVSLNPKKSFWLGRKPLRIPESMALSKEKVTGRPCFLNPTSAAGDSYAVGSMCKRLWVNTGIGDPTSLLHSLRTACCGQCFLGRSVPPRDFQGRGSFPWKKKSHQNVSFSPRNFPTVHFKSRYTSSGCKCLL